ncbi:MAG: hypothetical protein ACRC1K_21480 [Planctomycetia bacterium]
MVNSMKNAAAAALALTLGADVLRAGDLLTDEFRDGDGWETAQVVEPMGMPVGRQPAVRARSNPFSQSNYQAWLNHVARQTTVAEAKADVWGGIPVVPASAVEVLSGSGPVILEMQRPVAAIPTAVPAMPSATAVQQVGAYGRQAVAPSPMMKTEAAYAEPIVVKRKSGLFGGLSTVFNRGKKSTIVSPTVESAMAPSMTTAPMAAKPARSWMPAIGRKEMAPAMLGMGRAKSARAMDAAPAQTVDDSPVVVEGETILKEEILSEAVYEQGEDGKLRLVRTNKTPSFGGSVHQVAKPKAGQAMVVGVESTKTVPAKPGDQSWKMLKPVPNSR